MTRLEHAFTSPQPPLPSGLYRQYRNSIETVVSHYGSLTVFLRVTR